jgi:hypothetical protein
MRPVLSANTMSAEKPKKLRPLSKALCKAALCDSVYSTARIS